MSPEQAFHPESRSVVSTVLMLVLGLGVSPLPPYVALDLARRVRVLRTRAGALWLLGAASALATGVWSCQIIGVAAEPVAFRLGYDGGCMMALGAFFRGDDRTRTATLPWQALAALVLGVSLVGSQQLVIGAA